MSKKIIKKVLPEYFQDIVDGLKNYELRLNDFEVLPGDILVLEEWTTADPATRRATGRKLEKEVSYVRKFKLQDLWWTKKDLEEKGIQIISFKEIGDQRRPKVGVGVMLQNKEKQVLLGLRKSAHGTGEWSFPGGHLEFGESIFAAAQRETKEETGLDIEQFTLISVSDEKRYIASEGKHYVVIGLLGVYHGGQAVVMEKNKFAEWKWFDLDKLPSPLFEGTEQVIDNYLNHRLYQPND